VTISKDDLGKLILVQSVDREADALRKRLAQIPEDVAAIRADTEAGKAAMEAAKKKSQELAMKRKEKELEMAQKEAAIKKHQGELNAVKSNDAFKALLKEIEEAKKGVSECETEVLTLMDEGDAASRAEKAAAADFKSFEAKQGELVKSLEARKAELEAQLAGVEGRRKDLMAAVPAELSDRYDKTRVRRNGVGLSKLEGNLCTECRVSLPPQVVVNVKKGHTLEMCTSCQRILHDINTVTSAA
jgi:predicted  nucleic acid-binding Zn-ribbon protein